MANTHSIDFELSSSQSASITDANQTGLDLSSNFTIEAWVKLETLPSDITADMFIVSKDGDDPTGQRSYYFNIYRDDTIRIFWFNSSGGATALVSQTSFISTGTWTHIAVTVDITTPANSKFYIDGVQENVTVSEDNADGTIKDSNADVFISSRSAAAGGGVLYDGLIDEVRVWSDIRTSTEISDNYDKELVGTEANLVGYWKFNNSLLDETSNNNDLTNNNSATFSINVPFVGTVPNTSNFFQLF